MAKSRMPLKDSVPWQCAQGHVFYKRFDHVRTRGSWCLKCNGYERWNEARFKAVVHQRRGKLLSRFKGLMQPVDLMCELGHSWRARAAGIVLEDKWCRDCGRRTLVLERYCRAVFEGLLGKPFPALWPEWLKGLQLDGYSQDLSLAFEYSGLQHFRYVPHFHGSEDNFKKQLARDRLKRRLCRKNGVVLVELDYRIPEEDLEKAIATRLMALKFLPKSSWTGRRISFDKFDRGHLKRQIEDRLKEFGDRLQTDFVARLKQRIDVRCGDCSSIYSHTVDNILKNGSRCHCFKRFRRTQDDAIAVGKAKRLALVGDYKGWKTEHDWRCLRCNAKLMRTPFELKHTARGCSDCRRANHAPEPTVAQRNSLKRSASGRLIAAAAQRWR